MGDSPYMWSNRPRHGASVKYTCRQNTTTTPRAEMLLLLLAAAAVRSVRRIIIFRRRASATLIKIYCILFVVAARNAWRAVARLLRARVDIIKHACAVGARARTRRPRRAPSCARQHRRRRARPLARFSFALESGRALSGAIRAEITCLPNVVVVCANRSNRNGRTNIVGIYIYIRYIFLLYILKIYTRTVVIYRQHISLI